MRTLIFAMEASGDLYDTPARVRSHRPGIIVMMKRLPRLPAALALLLVSAACSKNIQNQDAVRAGMMDYFSITAPKIGLDMSAIQIDVPAVTFQKDHARATVSIRTKNPDIPAMELIYNLDRKGDKWVVAGPGESASGAHGAAAMPQGGPAPQDGQLPSGHPAIPDTPSGHVDPGQGKLPAGHPPIGTKQQ
jgi:hypothetical protein